MRDGYNQLIEVLSKDKRFLDDEGKLLKNKIQEYALKTDKELIKLLLSNKLTKKHFFVEVDGVMVFDKVLFNTIIDGQEFLPDSYTKFSQNIVLTNEYNIPFKQNNQVVLNFPFKDCLLEGGQTKEDEKRGECMLNETLLKHEIDNLLSPKIFHNSVKYEENKKTKATKVSADDNLIIKGNNLIALSSLLNNYEGKIDLINIDPPYNTGTDSFKYNDKFNHSTWLVFMKNRLEIAKKLLKESGSIYVQMDVKEVHYLKVLMDEIFGRENFRSEIIWDTSIPYVAGNKWLSNNWIYSHSIILYYAKNKSEVYFNKQTFDVKQKSGDISKKPYKDVWVDIENFAGFLGAKDIKINFNSRKPEKLIERIIASSCPENGIVLDFFAGSGTTLAAAHKMNRKYIGIEQMDSQIDIIVNRLNEVIKGEDKGISKSTNWSGGGSFIYAELADCSYVFIEKIKRAKKTEDLLNIYDELKKSDFVLYRVDIEEMEKGKKDFTDLSLENKKKFLISIIDKNTLYINYSDINNKDYSISKEDRIFTENFYKRGDE